MKWIALALLAACSESIDAPPLGDYTTWKRVDVMGSAPGHGDTYRIIYANDLAADPAWDMYLGYQEGSVIVKEVRDNDAGMPGDLHELVIMRRIGEVTAAYEADGGWLFSASKDGDEHDPGYCWDRCHVAAPYNGAWYDYRK